MEELPENETHSFIVRLWLEETEEGSSAVKWRGSVTHVPSGKRQYLKRLRDLNPFVRAHLGQYDPEFYR